MVVKRGVVEDSVARKRGITESVKFGEASGLRFMSMIIKTCTITTTLNQVLYKQNQ